MVIFHSYVSLPEGNTNEKGDHCFIEILADPQEVLVLVNRMSRCWRGPAASSKELDTGG